MSYTIVLWCGCTVYVACHPSSTAAHARVLEKRGAECRERRHQRGVRLWLWEMLPEPRNRDAVVRSERQ